MYTEVNAIFMKCLSGLHAGSGTDLGIVDMPIQREKHSGLPKVESSGIKGCLREEFECKVKGEDNNITKELVELIFGPDEKGDSHAGSAAFTDARLLLFPVRSAKGVFGYATCPYILERLNDDFRMIHDVPELVVPEISQDAPVQCTSEDLMVALKDRKQVVFEEYTYQAAITEEAREIANRIASWLEISKAQKTWIKQKLVIMPDDDFFGFVKYHTEVVTRIKIDPVKGTVEEGALFTVEMLPAESILYTLCMTGPVLADAKAKESEDYGKLRVGNEAKNIMDRIVEGTPKYLQLGGDSTLGKGLIHIDFLKKGGYAP